MLDRLAPRHWGFEWIGVLVLISGGLWWGHVDGERRASHAWMMQTEGEFAVATILDVKKVDAVRKRGNTVIPNSQSQRYLVDLQWRDYHKKTQSIQNREFWQHEADKLGLDAKFGETLKTLRIRYKLPTVSEDPAADASNNEFRARMNRWPDCTPSQLCKNVILDNPNARDPGLIFGMDFDPAPPVVGLGLALFLAALIARLTGKTDGWF
jgi:hypothetical protein